MRNLRIHKRFKLDLIDVSSKISLIGKVEIIDISLCGVAVKIDKKLNIGKECLLTLEYEERHINVKGIVVRSELSGIEERGDREKATIYLAGISFKDESADKVKVFLDSIEDSKKTQVPEQSGWFYRDIRFSITTPGDKVLNLSRHFEVKDISQSGIIIQTDHQLKISSMVLMELSLNACDPASFMGKIASCRMIKDNVRASYDIWVEFSELTDRDRSLLMSFITCVKENKNTGERRKKRE
ncbi:MAG TPA: PilZ domain-containing protein [Nitrospirota bacterium]|nr:PilZ domain-containing protein [Nitrospirota bacterium]